MIVRFLFTVFIGVLSSFFSVTIASACSCSVYETIKVSELLDNYDYVFQGQVLHIEGENLENIWGNKVAIFKPSSVYKGEETSTVEVHYTFSLSGNCLWEYFEAGKRYFIFANIDEDGNYRSPGYCSPSKQFVFEPQQIVSYFKNGIDDVLISQQCLAMLSTIFEEFDLTGELQTSHLNPTCADHLETYENDYRSTEK